MDEPLADEKTKFVQIRVPLGMLSQIDELIEKSEFTSRSEFFKRVAATYLAGSSSHHLREALKDPEVRQDIRQIVKEGL